MLFCVFFCFFFQAEDGIRDRDVTGVQTCALPISSAHRPSGRPDCTGASRRPEGRCALARGARALARVGGGSGFRAGGGRSEERRVGKEWRWRWGGGE